MHTIFYHSISPRKQTKKLSKEQWDAHNLLPFDLFDAYSYVFLMIEFKKKKNYRSNQRRQLFKKNKLYRDLMYRLTFNVLDVCIVYVINLN